MIFVLSSGPLMDGWQGFEGRGQVSYGVGVTQIYMANSRQWGYDNVGPAFGYMARVDVGEFSTAFLKHMRCILSSMRRRRIALGGLIAFRKK